MHTTEVQRVFILRPDNLGDVVLFSGTLRHIREFYPGAEITLCVKKYVRNLLYLCPHVDRMLTWENVDRPRLEWLPKVRGRYRFEAVVRRIVVPRKYKGDVVLLPVRSPTPAHHRIVRAVRARRKYGIAGDFGNQTPKTDRKANRIFTTRLQVPQERRWEHELAITRDFLRLLDIQVDIGDLWPEFWTSAEDRRWAQEFVPKGEAVTLAVCPGITSPTGKFYPGMNYAKALSALAQTKFAVVLFGSTAEASMCDEVAGAVASCENVLSVTNLAGESTIRQLIEGLRKCDAVLSTDSASLHIGVALRKPTVGIMGGGHFGRFYPWGDPKINRVVCKPMDCYHCNWECRYSTMRCVQEIPWEVVKRELRTALWHGDILHRSGST